MLAGARAACSRMDRQRIRMRSPARSRSPEAPPGLSPAVVPLPIPDDSPLGRAGAGIDGMGSRVPMKAMGPEKTDGACSPLARIWASPWSGFVGPPGVAGG